MGGGVNANALNLGFAKQGGKYREALSFLSGGFLSAGCVISEKIVSLPVCCDGKTFGENGPRNKHLY